MKQSFKMKYRNVISLVMAFVLSVSIVGGSHKHWMAENISLSFNSFNAKDITYKLYYTEDIKSDFSKNKYVSKRVKQGSKDVKIIIPADKLAKFKLDFGSHPGVVNISKLKLKGRVTIKLNDFVNYIYLNFDSTEVVADGSVTLVSEQDNPVMMVNKMFNLYKGFDINWLKLIALFSILYAFFYAFFMLILYEKKKKRKEFYDYY